MKLNIFKLFFVFLIVLLFSCTAIAWGPCDHDEISANALKQLPAGQVKTIIQNNLGAFRAGTDLNDISVIFYFSSFQTYKSTHNWNFCDKMYQISENDAERACALGCKAHLATDSISHNEMVPDALNRYKIFNNIMLHPLVEANLDSQCTKIYPQYADMLKDANKCYNVYVRTIGSDSLKGRKIVDLMDILAGSVGDFYGKAYGSEAQKSPFYTAVGFGWSLYQYITLPLSFFVNVGDSSTYEAHAASKEALVLQGVSDTSDPSGETALFKATALSIIISVVSISLVILGLFVLSMYYTFKHFRDNKKMVIISIIGTLIVLTLLGIFLWIFNFVAVLLIGMILYIVSIINILIFLIKWAFGKITLKFVGVTLIMLIYFISVTVFLLFNLILSWIL